VTLVVTKHGKKKSFFIRAKNFCEMFPKGIFLHLKKFNYAHEKYDKSEGYAKSTDLNLQMNAGWFWCIIKDFFCNSMNEAK
jgi:hypothetical protein